VRDERDRFVGFVIDSVEAWPERHRARSRARFVSDHELALDDGRRVVADRIVIATGSRTNMLPIFADFGDRAITNDEVFDWQDLPGAVAVFGAGVIGLELGQALHRLGVRVEIFGRDNLVGPLTDPDVIAAARDLLTAELAFHPHADVTRRARTETGIEIDIEEGGKTRTAAFDCALIATGRRPNVDDLGLENTALERDRRGIPVYDWQTGRCGDSHIFIAGDANDRFPLLHEAADDGLTAGYNAARFPEFRRFARSTPISVVFTDPQLMMFGETHRELTARGADFRTGRLDWSGQGRARVMRVNAGLLRLYGDPRSGRLLGGEMAGPAAEHIAHLLGWCCQSGLTVQQILERPFYHPVLEEGVRTALRDLNHAMQMGPAAPPRCIDCGPGG